MQGRPLLVRLQMSLRAREKQHASPRRLSLCLLPLRQLAAQLSAPLLCHHAALMTPVLERQQALQMLPSMLLQLVRMEVPPRQVLRSRMRLARASLRMLLPQPAPPMSMLRLVAPRAPP
jgi:hypothetical protein